MESINNILIPTDFSPAAWNAVQYGLLFQKNHQSYITLLHVYPVSSKYNLSNNGLTEEENSRIIDLKKRMQQWTDELKKTHNANIKSMIKIGDVSNEIHKAFSAGAFDFIIMGANGGSSSNEAGKNTSEIIRKANFPVLVVPKEKN